MTFPLNTVLATLGAAISDADSLDAIARAALDGVLAATGASRASILLCDTDNVMRFKAWKGLSDAYRAAVEGRSPWTPGDATDPRIVSDVAIDETLAAFREVHAAEGIRALAFVPVVSRGRAIGTFVLYGDQPSRFDRGELPAIQAIAYQIGFAVERARREADIASAHQRTLFALDAAQMGTWQWNLLDNSVIWSENLERLHGLPPGTFTGAFDSYAKEIHPEDRDRVFASVQRALTEGVPHDVEYRIVAPTGTVRWVHGKGRVERDANGTPIGMSGVCMVVSARKEAEAAVADALEREATTRTRLTELTTRSERLLTSTDSRSAQAAVLDLAVGVVPADGYALWQLEGDRWRITASRGLSDRFTATTLTWRPDIPFTQALVADDVTATGLLEHRRQQYAEEGIASLLSVPLIVRGQPIGSLAFYRRERRDTTDIELKVATALGQLAAAAISNALLYEEQQRLRREAEDAQLRSAFLADASVILSSLDYERNLHRVAELAVPDISDWCAVDLLSAAGTIERLAVAHRDPAQVAIAKTLHAEYPPRLGDPGVGAVIRTGVPQLHSDIPEEAIASSARSPRQLELLRALRIQSAMIVPLTAGRRTFGALSFVTTIGGRRLTETDLQFATELGRRAALAIENARLFEEAQRANRLKDEFLATLSHELRTPLNVILGRARRLQDAALTLDGAQKIGDAIERNADTLTRLVEDLLDVSRFMLGQVTLQLQSVDPRQLVQSVVAGVEPSARTKGIELLFEPGLELPAITGDPTRLQQVVWNLLMNAIKFTPPGGRVRVALTQERGELTLSVVDSGIGISPEFLPSVFDLFRQEEPTSTRQHGGLGLGLSIVRRLVELHGGHVRVDSAGRDQGATFEVRLPCAMTSTEAKAGAVKG